MICATCSQCGRKYYKIDHDCPPAVNSQDQKKLNSTKRIVEIKRGVPVPKDARWLTSREVESEGEEKSQKIKYITFDVFEVEE